MWFRGCRALGARVVRRDAKRTQTRMDPFLRTLVGARGLGDDLRQGAIGRVLPRLLRMGTGHPNPKPNPHNTTPHNTGRPSWDFVLPAGGL